MLKRPTKSRGNWRLLGRAPAPIELPYIERRAAPRPRHSRGRQNWAAVATRRPPRSLEGHGHGEFGMADVLPPRPLRHNWRVRAPFPCVSCMPTRLYPPPYCLHTRPVVSPSLLPRDCSVALSSRHNERSIARCDDRKIDCFHFLFVSSLTCKA